MAALEDSGRVGDDRGRTKGLSLEGQFIREELQNHRIELTKKTSYTLKGSRHTEQTAIGIGSRRFLRAGPMSATDP